MDYFKYIFEDTDILLNNDVIYIERSAHIFKHVLALAIDNNYPYPFKYKYELDYYGLRYTENNLYNPEMKITEKMIKYMNKLTLYTI